jgi:rhamnosyltransferase
VAALRVSVVLLTLDAGALLEHVLQSIQRQRIAGPWELLAVDSGSTDGTLGRLAAAGARVQRIPTQQFDFGLTRDHAFELARGTYIVTLSQDVVLRGRDAVERLLQPLADPRVAAVSSHLGLPEQRPVFLWQRMGRFYFTREMRRFRERYGKPLSHALSATRRETWQKLRHGPMPIAEDMRLQQRALAAGYRVEHVAEPLGTHANVYDLTRLIKRCYNEGLGARHLALGYSGLDLLLDLVRPDLWLALARQVSYGRLRSTGELLYPWLRPLLLFAGHNFGRSYWR